MHILTVVVGIAEMFVGERKMSFSFQFHQVMLTSEG